MVSFDGGSASKVDDVTALPSHVQDGGYALLWQRYDNNKMVAMRYYVLHLQQYSHRQLVFFPSSKCRLFHNATLFGSCIIHILYIYSTNIRTEYFKHAA